MPRYFFDIHDGTGLVDSEGTELSGEFEARKEAVRLAGACIAEMGTSIWNGDDDWRLEVKGEGGTVLFGVTVIAVG
jgi:hypothetical protein